MGVVRTLLAIAVVVTHAGPLFPSVTMIPGTLAVQAFYVISGFYMALVLSTKYSHHTADFYAARALRIFPVYWIVLAATIALNGAPFAELNDASAVLIGGANLLLFGQDALRYMQVDASGALSLDLTLSGANTYKFMPVPQAWTLALELEFYLLAPLLVRWSIGWLVLMGLASLSLREAALYLDWFGPWVYYALPFQLVFFVTGMLSYRLSQLLRISGLKLSLIFWLVVCAEIFMGSFSRVGWLLFVSLPIALPFIFQLTKRSRLDELIGQLSYPLYVCHLFVIYLFGTASVWPVMLGSLLVSIVLLIATHPIEQSRARLVRKERLRPLNNWNEASVTSDRQNGQRFE